MTRQLLSELPDEATIFHRAAAKYSAEKATATLKKAVATSDSEKELNAAIKIWIEGGPQAAESKAAATVQSMHKKKLLRQRKTRLWLYSVFKLLDLGK